MMLDRSQVTALLFAALLCISILTIGGSSSYFTATLASNETNMKLWVSQIWLTTTTAEFDAGVPVNVDTSGDQVKLTRTISHRYIYALSGDNSIYFTRYDIAANTWQPMANTLNPRWYGGALTYDYQGGDYLYSLAGGGTNNFARYSISANSWTARANTLTPISYGGALAFAQGFVYALSGGNTRNFARYDPVTNTWTSMAPTPATVVPVNAGGSLAYAGGNYIYALVGGGTTNFIRYDISANTWTSMAITPGSIGDGGAITWDGSNFLYAIAGGSGGGGKGFYRYNIATNTWQTLQDTPNPTRAGGAITSDKGDYIYFFQGGGTKFWRYKISTPPAFVEMTGNLHTIGWGGSLAYVPGVYCYSSPGTIASIVFDTTTPESRWDLLAWNATLPAGTAITFEVRASDTPFAKGDATPAWTPVTGTLVGGTYYVYSAALPAGRYIQWRATLTSSACASTPVLHDVTVYYTDP